jgi:hypothetical protein
MQSLIVLRMPKTWPNCMLSMEISFAGGCQCSRGREGHVLALYWINGHHPPLLGDGHIHDHYLAKPPPPSHHHHPTPHYPSDSPSAPTTFHFISISSRSTSGQEETEGVTKDRPSWVALHRFIAKDPGRKQAAPLFPPSFFNFRNTRPLVPGRDCRSEKTGGRHTRRAKEKANHRPT